MTPTSRRASSSSAPRGWSSISRRSLLRRSAAAAAALSLIAAEPALAHKGPDEGKAAYVMADWMLLSWAVFFVCALLGFAVALKRGLMRKPEAAKYHLLTIDEPDYYTPAWAKEADDV